MNLYDSVLRAFPTHSYQMNTAGTGYVDVANNGGTVGGTLAFSSPIVSANQKSLYASQTANTITSPVFIAGKERSSFTLEAWFAPMSPYTGNISILSHSAVFDGLYFDGDFIRFKVMFANGDAPVAYWAVPDMPKVYHVVGVYTTTQILLYIDGELVSTADISAAAVASGFTNAGVSTLTIGQASNATLKALVDGFSVYARGLSKNDIQRNFKYGLDPVPEANIYAPYRINNRDGSVRDIALVREWKTRTDWTNASMVDVAVSDDGIIPDQDFTTGVSRTTAVWRSSLEIASTGLSSLYGVKAEWDGDGSFTVASSTDGTTFTNLTNGSIVPGSFGLDPTNKIMDIRISFTGGLTSDPAIVRRLKMTVYRSALVKGIDTSRTFTLNGDVVTGDTPFLELQRAESSGIRFNNGTAVLSTDSSGDPKTIRTIEMWVKPTGIVSGTTSTLFSGGASATINDTAKTISWAGMAGVYANGAGMSLNDPIKYNQWTHLVFVLSGDPASSITFGSLFKGSMSHVGTSPLILNGTQVANLYKSYFGYPVVALTEVGAIGTAEPTTPLVAYKYNWGMATGS